VLLLKILASNCVRYLVRQTRKPFSSHVAVREPIQEMVRFGAHLQACMVPGWESHYVDFDTLNQMVHDSNINSSEVSSLWHEELDKVTTHFKELTLQALETMFEIRHTNELARRLIAEMPGLSKSVNRVFAESLYIQDEAGSRRGLSLTSEDFEDENSVADATEIQNKVLPLFEQRQSFGSINVEALRKIAKRVDKYKDNKTAEALYSELVVSLIANALSSDILYKMRMFVDDAFYNASPFPEMVPPSRSVVESKTPPLIKLSEFEKLSKMIASLDQTVTTKLVSHRGFHSRNDALHRPLENTVSAYEQAWAAGVHYCECDIALTLDGKLVLCHDAHLKRLAKNPDNLNAFKPVHELTLEELHALPLKNGTHAPTLEEVLKISTRSEHGALVIELKSGANADFITAALCLFFHSQPALLKRVAVVMSFDLYLIHNFNRYFKMAFKKSTFPVLPKIMLLTVDHHEAVENVNLNPLEVEMNWDEDISGAHMKSVLQKDDISLDGVYMQFTKQLLDPQSRAIQTMARFSESYSFGVWQKKNDIDSYGTAAALSQNGFSFINSDFPRYFASETGHHRKGSSTPPLVTLTPPLLT